MARSSCLVTGGAGFIGSHVVRSLIATTDVNVVVLDDLSGGFVENVPRSDRVLFVEGSIADAGHVARLCETHRFRYIYHLAAYAAEGLSHFIRRFNYMNNVVGSVNLINAAINYDVECFVFTSSIAVYGAGQVPMLESMVPQPEDPYGIAKYAVELDLKAAGKMHGMRYVIFRPHNVYGEFQNIGDRYRNVIGIFMNQIMRGEPLTVFGDGTQRRAFTYIGDIAPAIAQSAWERRAWNDVFNVGADNAYSVNHLVEAVVRAMGREEHPVQHYPARNEVHTAYCDHSKSVEVFGRQGCTPLDVGLRRMADWVHTAGARKSGDFRGIEVTKGLPPSWAAG